MASFVTAADLETHLKKTFTTAERDQADQILAGAVGQIRACVDQWISRVTDDTITIDAPLSKTLWLPQRPVVSVDSVTLDGTAVTDWRLRGSRLIRNEPWGVLCETREVVVVYTHGLLSDDEHMDLARRASLMLAAQEMSNPNGLKSRSIDDYREDYSTSSSGGLSEYLEKALRKQYGRRPATGSVSTVAEV